MWLSIRRRRRTGFRHPNPGWMISFFPRRKGLRMYAKQVTSLRRELGGFRQLRHLKHKHSTWFLPTMSENTPPRTKPRRSPAPLQSRGRSRMAPSWPMTLWFPPRHQQITRRMIVYSFCRRRGLRLGMNIYICKLDTCRGKGTSRLFPGISFEAPNAPPKVELG